jgi:hypothetical protein
MKDELGTYKGIPAMTPTVVHDYLRAVGKEWKEGVAIEIGCFLGATTLALLDGLKEAGYTEPYFAYDRWEGNEQQVEICASHGIRVKKNQDMRPLFLKNVEGVGIRIHSHKGDVPVTLSTFPNKSIYVCLLDAPKKDPEFTNCMERLIPYFIPGVTVLGLLDYNFWKKKDGNLRTQLLAPVRWMQQHKINFKQLAEWPVDCTGVFFKYVKKI